MTVPPLDLLPKAVSTPEAQPKANRDFGLDFAKGWFVLAMILHHSLNYYPQGLGIIKFVRFVSGAFIFISGFLVTFHYAARLEKGDKSVYGRLAVRGFKLLMLLGILNVITQFVIKRGSPRNIQAYDVWDWLTILFFTGDYRVLDFDLLAPIGYVLLSAAVVLAIMGKRKLPLVLTSLGILISAACLPEDIPGRYYYRYFAIGFLGVFCGLIQSSSLEQLRNSRKIIIMVYFAHLWVLPFVELIYPVYVAIVLLNCVFAYALASTLSPGKPGVGLVLLLGQYSLFCYLFQIGVLQLLKRIHPGTGPWLPNLAMAFVLTTLVSIGACLCLRQWRKRSQLIDSAYKAIFA